jgi:hypothetical protein
MARDSNVSDQNFCLGATRSLFSAITNRKKLSCRRHNASTIWQEWAVHGHTSTVARDNFMAFTGKRGMTAQLDSDAAAGCHCGNRTFPNTRCQQCRKRQSAKAMCTIQAVDGHGSTIASANQLAPNRQPTTMEAWASDVAASSVIGSLIRHCSKPKSPWATLHQAVR